MESIWLNICLIFGVISVSSSQQPPVIGLESVIQAYVKAEVYKQLKESQKNLIKRDEFTRVQQDVKKVTENLDNSIQGKIALCLHSSWKLKDSFSLGKHDIFCMMYL